MEWITLCLNRFDDDTKASFVDLYTKVDAGASAEEMSKLQQRMEAVYEEIGETLGKYYDIK